MMHRSVVKSKDLRIRPKLKIGQPNDRFEQEADAVADQVMKMPASQISPVQRKCHECEEEELQMKPLLTTLSPIVQKQAEEEEEEVLQMKSSSHSPSPSSSLETSLKQNKGAGQQLPASTHSFMSNAMDTDFSKVKIHTDANAVQMNRQLNAKAFTHGTDIYFNLGQYDPQSSQGKHLLAHELTHVAQQSKCGPQIQKQDETHGAEGGTLQSILPGYSQEGDTCGATSLVTALMIYDRESGGNSNEIVLSAINLVQTWLIHNRTRIIEDWNDNGFNGRGIYDDAIRVANHIREHLIQPDAQLIEEEYQMIGIMLYALYVDRRSGLSSSEIESLQTRLGLHTGEESNLRNYSHIFSNSIIANLDPGQIAQIGWMVRTGEVNNMGQVPVTPHAFIIGRFQNGDWFLSDQGRDPAAEFTAPILDLLRSEVTEAARNGEYWIYTGSAHNIIGWTGVRLLAGAEGVREQVQALIRPGTELAEIDAGALTIGDTLISGDFMATTYSRGEAHSAAGRVGINHGAVIVEIPRGVFMVYKTNTVRSANLQASEIDASGGGLLTRRIYYSAELVVSDGNSARMISVY